MNSTPNESYKTFTNTNFGGFTTDASLSEELSTGADVTDKSSTFTTSNKTSITTNPFEGGDGIGSIEFTPFNFNIAKQYDADAQAPKLSPFLSPEEAENPQPYSATNQLVITQLYTNNLQAQIGQLDLPAEQAAVIYDALTGQPVNLSPEAQKLAKTVKQRTLEQTRQQAHLPSNWNLNSKESASWTPVPTPAYNPEKQEEANTYFDQQLESETNQYIAKASPPLTEEQVTKLKAAIASGIPTPETATDFHAVEDLVTLQTQIKFSLPTTWFRGTATVENWTPTGEVNGIDPANFAIAFNGAVVNNLKTLVADIDGAANKVAATGAEGAVAAGNLKDYLKSIGEAIQDLKKTLYDLQRADLEKTRELSQAKFDMLTQRRKKNEDAFEKRRDASDKGGALGKLGEALRIIGPILSVVTVVIGVLITAFTAGAGTPLGIALITAGIAIAAISVTYSILDSTLQITSKLMALLDALIDEIMPNEPAWAKKLVKALIIALIAVVLVALLAVAMFSGGGTGVAASAATQTVTQVATQVVRQAVTQFVQQLLVQVLMILVMGSNAVPELVTSVAKEAGASKDLVLALQVISAVAMMVVMLVAVAAVTPGTMSAISQQAKNLSNTVKTGTQRVQDVSKMTMKQVELTMRTAINNVLTKMQTYIQKLPQSLANEFTGWTKTLKQAGTLQAINRVVQVLPSGVQMGASIYQGMVLMRLSELMKEIGDLKAAEEILRELINLLDKLMKNLQTSVQGNAEFIETLQNNFNSLYQAAGQSYGKLAESIIGRG